MNDNDDMIIGDNDITEVREPSTLLLPWVEKYRPQTINDICYHKQITNTLTNFIKNKDIPHLLFYGPPGTGKTSTIMSCAKEIYGSEIGVMMIQINVSEERGIEVIRNRVIQFVQTKSLVFSPVHKLYKLIILDEADSMTPDAQAILRRVIEKYTNNARFCLVCNYIKKINVALQSRCLVFRFSPIPDDIVIERINHICKNENISITNKARKLVLDHSDGDMRKILNTLQVCSVLSKTSEINDTIVSKALGYPDKTEITEIYNTIKNPKINCKKSYSIINKIKSNNGYSLNDIISEVFKKIINSTDFHSDIDEIISLANIEYNLIGTSNDDIQTMAFANLYKK